MKIGLITLLCCETREYGTYIHTLARDMIEFLGNQRKTGQKGRKTPHSSGGNVIFCHFRSNSTTFIFSKNY
jgi:hypothetical protein